MYDLCSISPFGPGLAHGPWTRAHERGSLVVAKLNTKILYTEIGADELKWLCLWW